jgi:hypothetical protein
VRAALLVAAAVDADGLPGGDGLAAVTVVCAGCLGGLPLPRFVGTLLLLLLPLPAALRCAGRTAVLLLAETAALMSDAQLSLILCTVASLVCGASLCIMRHHMLHIAGHGLHFATSTIAPLLMRLAQFDVVKYVVSFRFDGECSSLYALGQGYTTSSSGQVHECCRW